MDRTKICSECLRELPETSFALEDWDEDRETFIYSDVCEECENQACEPGDDDDDFCGEEDWGISEDDEWDEEYEYLEALGKRLAASAQMNLKIAAAYTEERFAAKIGFEPLASVDFSKVKASALEFITKTMGLNYVRELRMPPGNYIVMGDSHGIYAERGMVECIRHMAEAFDAQILHVGHVIDRSKNMPGEVLALPRLTVIPMADELPYLCKYHRDHPTFAIVREHIEIGNAKIRNQNYRGDYTISSSRSIRLEDDEKYEVIVLSRHLHEMHSVCRNGKKTVMITPGCTCERHASKKPRKRIPKDEKEFLALAVDSTYTGRRQGETNQYWENGIVVLHVRPDGSCTPVMCRAKKVDGEFAIAYPGSIFTEEGERSPDETGIVVGDVHVASHDAEAIDIVDQVVSELDVDFLVNVGDHMDMRSLNHHMMDRDEPTGVDVASECGKANHMLAEMGRWAPEKHIIIGNHGRFIEDFTKKMPQLSELLSFHVLSGAKSEGYRIVEEKGVLTRGPAKFCHGEMKMFGASGDRHSKMRNTMRADTMYGHAHSPSMRRGCYSIGMLGLLDQDYNEPEASSWMHGFGVVSMYGGECFMVSVPIADHQLSLGGAIYRPREDLSRWELPEFEAKIIYTQKR